MSVESIDISNVLPQGLDFTIEGKTYVLIYNYRAIKRLSDMYGSLKEATEQLDHGEDIYDVVLNFLFAGLTDEYGLKKSQIEEWIGPNSVRLLHNIIFKAYLLAYGKPEPDGEESPDGEGEA